MKSIARVVVDLSLDKEFDYRIPDDLGSKVQLGSRVVIPFGRRTTKGYVIGLADRSLHDRLKAVLSVEDERPYVDHSMLRLARWMSEYYCAPLERAIRAVLPGAVRRRGEAFKLRKFVELVEGGPAPLTGKARPRPSFAPRATADRQERATCSPILPESGFSEATSDQRLTPQQVAVLELLRQEGGLFLQELLDRLRISLSPVQSLERNGYVSVARCAVSRNPLSRHKILPTAPLELMPEQAEALQRITQAVDCPLPSDEKAGQRSRVVLLHGVTGSGKTEVYLQAIAHVLARGGGAIVLVPEIALTPQTVERFVARFGQAIAVLHSHLSEGERHDEWHRIREGKARVVIGARSAVFAPVVSLGLIVVDEEHEPSYKQEEVPRYNARDVAVVRGQMDDCVVVLGSATPALESWQNTRNGKYVLARLPRRADDRTMPVMKVVDMRIEAQRSGKPSVFSTDLIRAVEMRIARAEQTILFLNRRGYSTSLVCPQCGYVANCDQCSVSCTYHRSDERLRCHICGAESPVPSRCPQCADPSFRFAGIGTQRVERILGKLFPKARVERMDSDVTQAKDAYDRILGDFRIGKTDILIGTQMIAKGLHFPNVTLVGVIYADMSLHVPDFRAGERTFQLLAQVAGRAGRGDVSGEVIIQTYTPHHWAIQAARRLDYDALCDQELEFRKELSYPPFAHMICLTLRGPSERKTEFTAQTLADAIRARVPRTVTMADACPAPLAKARGQYRYHIMLRARSASSMTRPLKVLLKEFRFPKEVHCSVDVDALSLL